MNGALELVTGDYVGLFDHDDLLTPDCLYEFVASMQEVHHDCVYSDEDKLMIRQRNLKIRILNQISALIYCVLITTLHTSLL